jgi:hypothetical protein
VKVKASPASAFLCLWLLITGALIDDPALEFPGVRTRYLRVVNPTGYISMPEIVIYGAPVP